MTMGISLMSYSKRSNDNFIFDVARSGRIASVRATTIRQPSRDARTQESNNIYMLLVTRMKATSNVDCMDDNNEGICCIA
jgi:hypothetical protein